ncbi:4-carboxy-4-hydroxy-2-oxoadipate aldolase/oxaloacetate decarboxylase [Marinomonas polaris]|uniref:4-carboxy-4-hydroxy-2-oxoadipate aldolase/oxaloacetate decarboxylase n=1 Tax=Marinomonas polaris TaxID=293552 RepID=UPI003F9CCEB7
MTKQTIKNDELLKRLKELGTATVYEAQGGKGALDSGMKPLSSSMTLAGPALTLDCKPADNLMIHYALLQAKPGDVLVIDAKGFLEAGPWGDVLTEQALAIGLAGLVINGSVRDAKTIIEMGFPVFCRGISIKGTGKNQPGEMNVPICIGDVQICPGDIVIGDQDGLVIVNPDKAQNVLEMAELRESKEAVFREQIRAGKTTLELLGLENKFL